jgi:hypothetical protein
VDPKWTFQDRRVFWKFAMRREPKPPTPFVVPVRPFTSNERIHVQRGLFLCATDVNLEFEENLLGVAKRDELRKHIFKLKIPRDSHPDIMKQLRDMNISCETLYPGLEGFARSLRDLFYLPDWQAPERRLRKAISKKPLF